MSLALAGTTWGGNREVGAEERGEAAGGQVPRHNGEKPLNAGTWQRSSGLFFERKKMEIAALGLSILE